MLVGFGATANLCAFYLMNSTTVEAFKAELKSYDASKGTIRFQPNQPLPMALVRKLVKSRIAENTLDAENDAAYHAGAKDLRFHSSAKPLISCRKREGC